MAAGLFIVHLRRYIRGFPILSSDWLPSVRHQQLVHMRQLVRQQTIESIFQMQGMLPNGFRLTHALALAVAT
jgi:hypothetical protein